MKEFLSKNRYAVSAAMLVLMLVAGYFLFNRCKEPTRIQTRTAAMKCAIIMMTNLPVVAERACEIHFGHKDCDPGQIPEERGREILDGMLVDCVKESFKEKNLCTTNILDKMR